MTPITDEVLAELERRCEIHGAIVLSQRKLSALIASARRMRRFERLVRQFHESAEYAIKNNLFMDAKWVLRGTDVVLNDKVPICEVCGQGAGPGGSKYCDKASGEKPSHKWIWVARSQEATQ